MRLRRRAENLVSRAIAQHRAANSACGTDLYDNGRRHFLKAVTAGVAAAALTPVRALGYPDRPIKLVVPFSPGGATDVVGRLWAERMKPQLGTVVTENRGGGGGLTG